MGDREERVFVRMFQETPHWWAQRAAASGSGGDGDLPDVTFAQEGIAFAGEEKTTSEPYIYVQEDELEALRAYADAYGMETILIGRFKGERAFYVWNPEDMERTNAGTYRGSPGDEKWAAKIAEPDGSAEGVYPEDLTAFALYHSVNGRLGKGMVEAPKPDPAAMWGSDQDQDQGGEADG
ncbi:hypothetical protein [Natronosalvus rutilus]|uniref:Uncharacterized protein n=1 Tax=Natronosalvus rutilus TaxID=2953753 RepID=A0A9E7SYG6_9EURY|nr:hypothetical protein [Natronosalvus rutilus]UTF56006.1 hypothetical protein NGM29_20680 [Natronosalvus rutilus]